MRFTFYHNTISAIAVYLELTLVRRISFVAGFSKATGKNHGYSPRVNGSADPSLRVGCAVQTCLEDL